MSKILLVLNHPNLKESFVNNIIVNKLKQLIPDIEFDHIDSLYPDGKIDVKAEQEKLLRNDTIIFQYPMYWYKNPYLLSKWLEDVYEHGFAYGSKGDKLKDKRIIVSMTMNCRKDEFHDGFSIDKVISPWLAIADYTKQKYVGFEGTYDIPFEIKQMPERAQELKKELEQHAERVAKLAKNN